MPSFFSSFKILTLALVSMMMVFSFSTAYAHPGDKCVRGLKVGVIGADKLKKFMAKASAKKHWRQKSRSILKSHGVKRKPYWRHARGKSMYCYKYLWFWRCKAVASPCWH